MNFIIAVIPWEIRLFGRSNYLEIRVDGLQSRGVGGLGFLGGDTLDGPKDFCKLSGNIMDLFQKNIQDVFWCFSFSGLFSELVSFMFLCSLFCARLMSALGSHRK